VADGYLIKKVHNILLYDAGQFYVKKQDGGWIKICEIFCGSRLKEDLSIDTTFDPCYFSWDRPFNWETRVSNSPKHYADPDPAFLGNVGVDPNQGKK